MNFKNNIVKIIFATSIGMVFSTSLAFATNIGTDVTTNNLTVGAVLKIPTGAALNDILTSDAIGNASWATPANLKLSLGLDAASSPIFAGMTLSGDLDMATHNITNGGTVTANLFVGNGSALTTLDPNNLSNGSTLNAGVLNSSLTSVGTLSSLTMGGAIDLATNNINNGGTITAASFVGPLTGNASTATNIAGGSAGSVPYQTAANTTGFLGIGSAGQMAVVNAGATAPSWVTMSGDATMNSAGSVTIPKTYGMFYGLTSGVGNVGTDYAATIAPGTAVPFPRIGPASGTVFSFTPTQFFIGDAGNYEINFSVHTEEPGQLILLAGGVEQPQCLGDHGAGTGAIIGNCIITVGAGTFIEVDNPAGNVPALTVSPANGASTRANAETLVIKKL